MSLNQITQETFKANKHLLFLPLGFDAGFIFVKVNLNGQNKMYPLQKKTIVLSNYNLGFIPKAYKNNL